MTTTITLTHGTTTVRYDREAVLRWRAQLPTDLPTMVLRMLASMLGIRPALASVAQVGGWTLTEAPGVVTASTEIELSEAHPRDDGSRAVDPATVRRITWTCRTEVGQATVDGLGLSATERAHQPREGDPRSLGELVEAGVVSRPRALGIAQALRAQDGAR